MGFSPRVYAEFSLLSLALSVVFFAPFLQFVRTDWREMPAEILTTRLDEFRCCTVLEAQHLPAGNVSLPGCPALIEAGEPGTCVAQSCPRATFDWGECSTDGRTYACRTESGCDERRSELRDVVCATCADSHVTLRVGEIAVTRQERCGVEDGVACRAQLLAERSVGSVVDGYTLGSGPRQEADFWQPSASLWDFSSAGLIYSMWSMSACFFCASLCFALLALRGPLARGKRAAGRAAQRLRSARPRACVNCIRDNYIAFTPWVLLAVAVIAGVALFVEGENQPLPEVPEPVNPYVPATFNVLRRNLTSFPCCTTVPEKRCRSMVTPLPTCESQIGIGSGLCSEPGLCCHADCIRAYWARCSAPDNISYACRRYRRGEQCSSCTPQTDYSALQIDCGRCAQLAAHISIADQPLKWHTATCGVDDLHDGCVERLQAQWPAGERDGFVRRGEGKLSSWRSSAPFDGSAERERRQREEAEKNPPGEAHFIAAYVCFGFAALLLIWFIVLYAREVKACALETCACACRTPVSPSTPPAGCV